MDRLGFLEMSHIVRSLGTESKDVREFRDTMHAFHEFVTHTHHPDVAATVLKTGEDLIRATTRSEVATIARGLSAKLRPRMHLKVHRESETVFTFSVTFPNFIKLNEEDRDLYHRRVFLEVHDLMQTVSEYPPVIVARLWDGDIGGTLRSTACSWNDPEGTLHFSGDGATYRTSIQMWRQGVPAYLVGVYKIHVRVDINDVAMSNRL